MDNNQQFYARSYSSELSFKNKLGRLLWGLVWCLLFRPSPRPLFGWRRMLLRLFGAKIHPSAAIYASVKVWAPWNLKMEARSVIGDYVDCYSVAGVILEEDATVSQYTFLCTASHDIESASRDLTCRPIVIGRGAWVFASSFVGMGVNVGEGAVVAAGSVVVKDVSPYTVVGGNPAKYIKSRRAIWVDGWQKLTSENE